MARGQEGGTEYLQQTVWGPAWGPGASCGVYNFKSFFAFAVIYTPEQRHTRPDPITNQNFKKKKKQAAAFHFLEAFCWLWRSFVDQRSEITRYHRALLYRTPRRLDEARDLGGS